MSNLKLDRTRPYGIVAGFFEEGDPMHGSVHSQDGFLFDAEDELIERALTEKDRVRLSSIVARNAAMDAARAKFMEIAPDTDPAELEKIISATALDKTDADKVLTKQDLVDYHFGRQRIHIAKIAQAYRRIYNVAPQNKQQRYEILANDPELGLLALPGESSLPFSN